MGNRVEAYDRRLSQYATATFSMADRQERPLMVAEEPAPYGKDKED